MLHVHSKIPSRFQNTNYEIKLSDFVLAKSSIVPLVNKATKSVIEETSSTEPVKPILNKSLSYPSTNNAEVTNDKTDDVDSSSTEDEDSDSSNTEADDFNEDINRPPRANNNEPGPRHGNLDIEESEDEGTENSNDDEGAIGFRPVRPQRASKAEAYRTRLWLRDNESEAENSEVYDDAIDQVDGNYLTPESLTPDTSPLKEHEEINKHENDDLISNASTINLQWDNYACSPELSGFRWINCTFETETCCIIWSLPRFRTFEESQHYCSGCKLVTVDNSLSTLLYQ